MASQERIASVKAEFELDEAKVAAQVDVIQASFEALGRTLDSTADVINSSFQGLVSHGAQAL